MASIPPPTLGPLAPPPRLMMGPGPSNCDPRVYAAMSLPQVGHMDGAFIKIVEEIKAALRYVWQTENEFTVPVSGTGSAAWEAALANMIEPDDVVLVCVNGYFGVRALDMCSRYGAKVEKIEAAWGETFSVEAVAAAIAQHKPKIVHVTHAETSTGACQPMEGLGEACHAAGALLLLDTVTSICGLPVYLDKWGVDIAFAGGQKCMGMPPGLSPLTFSARALEALAARKTPVKNWYLDMTMIQKYLVPAAGVSKRVYHHTAPVSMAYAMRAALGIVVEETLEVRWARHRANAELLWAGLEKIGVKCHVEESVRLPSLTTACVPEGIDAGAVCKFCLENYNLEVGGGLGELGGKVWRIGLMGYNSRAENVITLCAALEAAMADQRK